MIAKFILLAVLHRFCVSAVVLKIRPPEIIEYETLTADATVPSATPADHVEGDRDHHLLYDDDYPEPDVPEHPYDCSSDRYPDLGTADPPGDERVLEKRRPKPIHNEDGAAVLNPYRPEASKNASYVAPLYGNSSSYAGYLSVDERRGAHLFFWFFAAAEGNASDAPLIVWLQGQPGTSVLVGLFEEHGPYFLDETGTFREREFAWTREFNVLYLDHCVPCGFSYADDANATTTTIASAADIVYEALSQFYAVFDEYADNDVYLAGEYGCGKLIPAVCRTIHAKNTYEAKPVNLKGALIGNGIVDIHSMVNYGQFWFHWGLADANIERIVGYLEETIEGYIRADAEADALNYFRYHIFAKLRERGFDSPFDMRRANNTSSDWALRGLVDQELFRKWIHVGNRSYYVGHEYLSRELLADTSDTLPLLLEHYKMLYYNGQFDMLFPHDQTTKFLRTVGWSGLEGWYRTDRRKWYVDDQLTGYSKSYKTLTQVLVRNAGHMVGQTQPRSLLHLLRWFVNDMFAEPEKGT